MKWWKWRPVVVTTWQEFESILRQEGCKQITAVGKPTMTKDGSVYGGKFDARTETGRRIRLHEHYTGPWLTETWRECEDHSLLALYTVYARLEELEESFPSSQVRFLNGWGDELSS